MYLVMPKLKPGTIFPTPEEDAAINAGIAADPDTYELSDAEFAQLKPFSLSKEMNMVLLEPDIACAFPNDAAVNKALRYLLEIAQNSNQLIQLT